MGRATPLFLLITFFFGESMLYAQQQDSLKLRFGVEVSISDSYTGVGTQLGLVVRKKQNEFALRFKTSLTYMNNDENIPYGLGFSYRRITLEKKHFCSFIEAEYENIFFKHYSYINDGEKFYQAHELYIGYGIGYRSKHFMIRNTLSYGAYGEVLFEDDEDEIFYHISPKIKVALIYLF